MPRYEEHHDPRTITPTYRNVGLTVRPARLAVFVPEIRGWGLYCAKKSLEVLSSKWGGASNILVPLDEKGEIPAAFWKLLKAFDADMYGIFQPTFRDMSEAAPQKYHTWKNGQIDALKADGMSDQKANQFLEKQVIDDPGQGIEVADSIKTRIERELAPVLDAGHVHIHWLSTKDDHATGLVDMSVFGKRPGESITVLDTTDLDARLEMMLLDRTGCVGQQFEERVRQCGRLIHRQAVNGRVADRIINLSCHGVTQPERYRALGQSDEPGEWASPTDVSMLPLRQTEFCCEWRVGMFAYRFQQPFVVVVGDKLADFCLSSCLNRLTARSAWLPLSFALGDDDLAKRVRECLWDAVSSLTRSAHAGGSVLFTSCSVSIEEVQKIVQESLKHKRPAREFSAKAVEPDRLPLLAALRLVHERLNGLHRYEAFVGDCLAGFIDTPIPYECAEHAPQDVTWYIDVAIKDFAPPTRSCLNSILLRDGITRTWDGRCSSAGVSYYSQPVLTYSGERIERMVQRPSLRCPQALQIFAALLERDGLHAEVSDKGKYMLACIQRFGSLQDYSAALSQTAHRKILDGFRKPKPKDHQAHTQLEQQGVGDEHDYSRTPVFLDRWYYTFSGFCHESGLAVTDARLLIDRWIANRILSRGLILKCPACGDDSWYAAEEVGHTLQCRRCQDRFPMDQRAWRIPHDEPWWYYALSEVVYQALSQNGPAPALALKTVSQEAGTFLYSPELKVRSEDGFTAEVDLWAIRDGRIVLGEVTTTDNLTRKDKSEPKRLKHFCHIARAVTADEVVFVTTRDRWADATRARIESAVGSVDARWRLLENLEVNPTWTEL